MIIRLFLFNISQIFNIPNNMKNTLSFKKITLKNLELTQIKGGETDYSLCLVTIVVEQCGASTLCGYTRMPCEIVVSQTKQEYVCITHYACR